MPAAPNLTARATPGGVVLNWNAVAHAVRYELWTWWDAGVGWQAIGGANLTGTTWTHAAVNAGTTYYYSIRALNAAGDASAWLELVSVRHRAGAGGVRHRNVHRDANANADVLVNANLTGTTCTHAHPDNDRDGARGFRYPSTPVAEPPRQPRTAFS